SAVLTRHRPRIFDPGPSDQRSHLARHLGEGLHPRPRVTDSQGAGASTQVDREGQPELAKFQFRARNTWLGGAHNRTSIKDFYAAGGEDTTRSESFILDAGEPPI